MSTIFEVFQVGLDDRVDGHERARRWRMTRNRGRPQEPVGFVAGGVIGAFAAGPIGAVVGAGLGTWLGNRVHRAGEAKKAEAQVAMLESDKSQLQSEKSALAERKEPAGAKQPGLERQAR